MATNTPPIDNDAVMQKIKKSSERTDAAQPAPKAAALRPTIRLPDADIPRIYDMMRHALSVNKTINATTAVRLALLHWDFEKHLTADKIDAIRVQDRRYRNAVKH